MKKIASMTLSLCLITSLMASTTLASCTTPEIEQVITFEEYYTCLQEEYAKYDIGYTIERDENSNIVYTQKMLEQSLAAVKEFVDSIKITTSVVNSPELVETIDEIQRANLSDATKFNFGDLARVMPVSGIKFSFIRKIEAGGLSAGGDGEVSYYCGGAVTLNVQNDYVMSLDWENIQQIGKAVNFVKTDSLSFNPRLNLPSMGYINPTLSGYANFAWKGLFGDNVTYRVPFSEDEVFYVPDLM